MRRTLGFALRVALVTGIVFELLPSARAAKQRFTPADITNAGDIPYPVNSIATGMVSLLVSLESSAQVKSVQVERDIPSLTNVAQSAVHGWAFTPALLRGAQVPSSLAVNVVFNPYNPGGVLIGPMVMSPPTTTVVAGAGPHLTPPQVASASFAIYPINSLATGTVVLDVTVDKTGQITRVHVVCDVLSLTPAAISAVETWSFDPALFEGRAIASHTIVAFVFQRRSS